MGIGDVHPFHLFLRCDAMSLEPNGALIPVGGGDAIPLIRQVLTVGRRSSCDICLHFPNVSGNHCELTWADGCWIISDLDSTNGIKVNGSRVKKKALRPDDTIMIGKRQFKIEYTHEMGHEALAEFLDETEELLDVPLLEKAGLVRPPKSLDKPHSIDQLRGRQRPPTLVDDEDDPFDKLQN